MDSLRSAGRVRWWACALGIAAIATGSLGVAANPTVSAPPVLAREFRAAWVSPVAGNGLPDWPSRPGLTPDSQRAELRALLDQAKAIGLNAVILHVRPAADALYPSKRVPWSAFLSGKSGVGPTPEYDPLAFAVAEAHARGLQLHAWFNPYRAMLPNFVGKAAANHVTRAHPSWIRHYGTQTWIDPGDPVARASVLADILEVVDRYDIDGVHLDDYFYPYREQQIVTERVGKKRVKVKEDIPFPDATNWKKYGLAKGWTDRAAWRRANVDSLVKELYEGVKARKPWVLVGISPFGIWKSGTPDGVTGLDAFGEIYADSRLWLQEGWVDYLAPQLYWPLDGVESRFSLLDAWWDTQNPLGRHIWPGLYSSRVNESATSWGLGEIDAQISQVRADRMTASSDPGHIHFRMGGLIADDDALGEELRAAVYADPALVPAAPWLEVKGPGEPVVAWTAEKGLTVARGDSVPVNWWLVQTLQANGEWISSLHRANVNEMDLDSTMLGDVGGGRIAVTAIDRAGENSVTVVVERQ